MSAVLGVGSIWLIASVNGIPPWAYFFLRLLALSFVGVGNISCICVAKFGTVVPLGYFSIRAWNFSISCTSSFVVGVSNKPNSISFVGRTDTCSRKYKRLNFVPVSFQVSTHLFEDQPAVPRSKPAYVLAHDPTGWTLSNNSKHLRPQMAFVVWSLTLSCDWVGLARESSAEDINSSSVSCRIKLSDVCILFGIRKVMF